MPGDVDGLAMGSAASEYLPEPNLPDRIFTPMIEVPTIMSARVGWWSVSQKGSPNKVGEYQSTKDSLFFDVDSLISDGVQTYDFNLTQFDNDARNGRLNFYNPLMRGNVNYQSFLRRLDRDPLDYYVDFDKQPPLPLPGPPQNYRDMKEDLAVGQDFAIRVQQLQASFKGNRTGAFNWRLNVWGMKKTGERQANAMAHCFAAQNAVDTNGNPALGPACHQLSQQQRIDWLTAEIEPVLQAKFGNVTAEYARTMRTLTTDDQLVTRPYDNFGFSGDQPYSVVPENYTYIDRLRLSGTFQNNRDFYARLFSGNTRNQFRDTDRSFSGVDIRLTDRSIAGLSVTGYVKKYNQSGNLPAVLLPFETATNTLAPIGYDRTSLGVTSSWQPFYGQRGPSSRWRLMGGYEYRQLDRDNAIFQERVLTVNEDSTLSNQIFLRASTKLTPTWNSFTGYRLTFVDSPLYGVPIGNTTTNTNLPTETQRVEFGNTWTPTHTFMLNNLLSFHDGHHNSSIANFDTDNSDIVLSFWYAPVPLWSFSGGLGLYSNWIDQDITLGSKVSPLTQLWQYGGRSSVVNLGTTYAWTPQTTVSGTVDWVRGHNSFDPISGFGDLPALSDVIVETTRFTTGIDHAIGPNSSVYLRYQLMDYDDKSDGFVGGTIKMLLVGMNARF
ncbi:MAG: hypothetical protein KDB23_23425, partial [Planctomycetales bacterium]|nr:hypothetical protein [Planctomycetales bacterium]